MQSPPVLLRFYVRGNPAHSAPLRGLRDSVRVGGLRIISHDFNRRRSIRWQLVLVSNWDFGRCKLPIPYPLIPIP